MDKAAEKVEITKREMGIYEMEIGTEVEESVIRSGVVDGAKYWDAVEAIKAAAVKATKVAVEAAAAKAAKEDGVEDDNAKSKSESKEDKGLSKSQKTGNDATKTKTTIKRRAMRISKRAPSPKSMSC